MMPPKSNLSVSPMPMAAKKAELIGEYRKIIDVYRAASNAMIDDVIDPRETRPTVIRAFVRKDEPRGTRGAAV